MVSTASASTAQPSVEAFGGGTGWENVHSLKLMGCCSLTLNKPTPIAYRSGALSRTSAESMHGLLTVYDVADALAALRTPKGLLTFSLDPP